VNHVLYLPAKSEPDWSLHKAREDREQEMLAVHFLNVGLTELTARGVR
jgi:hypothetical protein